MHKYPKKHRFLVSIISHAVWLLTVIIEYTQKLSVEQILKDQNEQKFYRY